MQLHSLKRPSSLKREYRRVGRGQSSTRGKQSGRGGKGQTARAGNKRRPEWRDIIKKLPKRRGYGKNRGRTVNASKPRPFAISLSRLEKFDAGTAITPAFLAEQGMLRHAKQPVKIVAGESTKKFSFKNMTFTSTARAAAEKAGSTIA
jgi:large subunit ribosomal protein L15